VHGLSETDHVSEHLDPPEVVAGPQSLVFVNETGATTAVRMIITYHLAPMPMTQWTMLKTRTSFESIV